MVKFHKKVPISYQELGAHKINRPKVFLKLCNEFKKRYPNIKLIYAYINPNPIERLQFMLIFKFTSHVKTRLFENYMTKYTIICGNAVSYTSLEGFDICDSRNELDNWFSDVMTQPATYPEKFFKDIINRNPDLTYDDKNSDKYWKKPENADKLINHLDRYLVSFYQSIPTR